MAENFDGTDRSVVAENGREVLGPDGKFYPQQTKTISGLRPIATERSTLTRGRLAEALEELPDEQPTIPDLSSLAEMARRYEEAETDLLALQGAADVTRMVSDTEMQVISELQTASELLHQNRSIGFLPTAGREIGIVQGNYRYRYPWWQANSSIVRLWGQLDCICQLFDDSQLLKDLADVLGKDWVDLGPGINTDSMVTFVFMTRNAQIIKEAIRKKFPALDVLFGAIIEKQDKE